MSPANNNPTNNTSPSLPPAITQPMAQGLPMNPGQAMQQNPQVQALLEQLEPIKTPDNIGLWPLAPGWWVLLLLVTAITASLISYWLKIKRSNRYRHQALTELNKIKQLAGYEYLQNLQTLLKRAALCAYPLERNNIAGTYGDNWLQFLNQKCPAAVFVGSHSQALVDGLHRPSCTINTEFLSHATERWLKTHKPAEKPKAEKPVKIKAIAKPQSKSSKTISENIDLDVSNKSQETSTDPNKIKAGLLFLFAGILFTFLLGSLYAVFTHDFIASESTADLAIYLSIAFMVSMLAFQYCLYKLGYYENNPYFLKPSRSKFAFILLSAPLVLFAIGWLNFAITFPSLATEALGSAEFIKDKALKTKNYSRRSCDYLLQLDKLDAPFFSYCISNDTYDRLPTGKINVEVEVLRSTLGDIVKGIKTRGQNVE